MICKAVKESGRVFQVGTQQRSVFGRVFSKPWPSPAAAGSARNSGKGVGGHRHRRADRSRRPSPAQGTRLRLLAGPGPKVPFCPKRIGWNFRWWFDYSGGQVTDWGVHHTDIALWALGGEKTGAVEVEGTGEFPLGRQLMLDYLLGKKSVADLPNKL